MLALTILSPHRDDAVFSLSIGLLRWSSLKMRIRVLNVFTISSYAPRIDVADRNVVSSVRKREDRRALRAISPDIAVLSCDFLDAPLRLNITVDSVCKPQCWASIRGDLEAVARCIKDYFRKGLVLAPLGLGDHVDHLLVKDAATSIGLNHNLGFYEDLPYAEWTSETALFERVRSIEGSTRTKLEPAVIRTPDATQIKQMIVKKYQSQITPEQGLHISRFAERYKRGERIWMPRAAREWKYLVR